MDHMAERDKDEAVRDEVDMDDDDDATGSDSSNYSSASEDALPPIHAHGHVYHGSGRIMIPNDNSENERQAHQHELLTLCLGGSLTLAKLPLDRLHASGPSFHVLDVGSGGGHWAMAMARANPLVDVLGIELSGAQLPKEVPPNLTFEIADAAEPWPPRLYDFIHMRNLVGGGIRDWHALLREAYAHLKPGGQLEFTEATPCFFDINPPTDDGEEDGEAVVAAGSASAAYCAVFAEISREQEIDFDPIPKVGPWLLDLGADELKQRSDFLPVRGWSSDDMSRKKGEILSKMLTANCEHSSLRMFGIAGWNEEKTRALLEEVKREWENPSRKSCIQVTFITARKPVEAKQN